MARSKRGATPSRQLRIIGGRWRGRKITFPDIPGLRPTPDRVRETVFNWLAPYIHDAVCLDLFAGSGALGLEALSRGARHCSFVDSAPGAQNNLKALITTLDADTRASCYEQPAAQYLQQAPPGFDLVFLDPPYRMGLVETASALLAGRSLLAADALIYVETAAAEPLPSLPDRWELHREKHAGDVAYRLFRVTS